MHAASLDHLLASECCPRPAARKKGGEERNFHSAKTKKNVLCIMIRPFGSTAALVAMSILVSCRGSSAPPETPDAWGSVMVGNSSSADSGSRGGGGRGRGDGGGGRASRASQEDNLMNELINQRASPPLGRNPKLYFARTAAKLKRAALQWHADAVANHGWLVLKSNQQLVIIMNVLEDTDRMLPKHLPIRILSRQ